MRHVTRPLMSPNPGSAAQSLLPRPYQHRPRWLSPRLLALLMLLLVLAGASHATAQAPGPAAPTTQAPRSAAPPVFSISNGFSEPIHREFDAALQDTVDSLGIPGLMASLTVGGVGSWRGVTGVADLQTGEPLRFDQHVRIGSITKTFTVPLILQLADEGQLGLDDPISRYIADVPNGDRITLRQLANMTSGLASYTFEPEFQEALFADPSRSWRPEELVDIALAATRAGCPNQPADACFPPGEGFFYNNTNTVMLGLVVERVTGRPYADVLQEKILGPLGMTETSVPASAALPEPFAHGYSIQGLPEDAAVDYDATLINPSWGWAVGNIISTLDDLAIWARALGRGTLLSPQMQRERLTPLTLPPNTADHAYALGIGLDRGWWGHTGELPGYNTVVYYRPDVDATLVVSANHDFVLSNGQPVSPANTFASQIIAIAAREAPVGALDPDTPFSDPPLEP